jgi:hypothetical protein
MRNDVTLRALGVALIATLASLGCAAEESKDPGGSGDTSNSSGEPPPPPVAPEFPAGSGQAALPNAAYPAGPYGIGKGSVVENFQFIGYANAQVNNTTMQAIQLADFYNPHGKDPGYVPESPDKDDRLFPAGSPYGEGTKKPTVLAIDVASVWCGPCNNEAKYELPPRHLKYKPCGGEFFLQLADGPTVGTAATPTNLLNWTKKYLVDFPATIDPSYKLGALFKADAFPANFIIDTTNMKIVEVVSGVPNEFFWTKYESLLPDSACVQ